MSSDDIAISVRGLTKSYRLFGHPGDRVKQFFSLGLKHYHREFTALQDVSFDIRKGETVGIIGRNGSGKSTLLQLICGILKPTSGSVTVSGRVAALLELGAGFNPEFTGRENIYFQGALMGLTEAQMDERFVEITAFADIGEFIDQPVRTYSSGMFVRLAFAVAINVDADVLIVDEAIAVGDTGFRARCFRRLGELAVAGCTVVFVTHALEQVSRFCNRAMLLDYGRLIMHDYPEPVVASCLNLQAVVPEEEGTDVTGADPVASAYAANGAKIGTVYLVDTAGQEVRRLEAGKDYRCGFSASLSQPASGVRGALMVKSNDGLKVGGTMTAPLEPLPGSMAIDIDITFCCRLNPATYQISVALFACEGGIEFALHGIQNAIRFEVTREEIAFPLLGAVDLDCRPSISATSAG